MKNWNQVRNELNITAEDELVIKFEKELLTTLMKIREEQGISQTELANISGLKQPAIARIEKGTHSPQVDSILKILIPMGYTLNIVPIKD